MITILRKVSSPVCVNKTDIPVIFVPAKAHEKLNWTLDVNLVIMATQVSGWEHWLGGWKRIINLYRSQFRLWTTVAWRIWKELLAKPSIAYPNILSAIRPWHLITRSLRHESCTLDSGSEFEESAPQAGSSYIPSSGNPSSKPHVISEAELNNLSRALDFPKNKAELRSRNCKYLFTEDKYNDSFLSLS